MCLNEFFKQFIIKKIYFFDNINSELKLECLNKKFEIIKSFKILKKKIDKDTYFFLGIGDNLKRKNILDETINELGNLNWLKLISKIQSSMIRKNR